LRLPVCNGHGKRTDKFLVVLGGEGDGTYISSPAAGSINTSRQWIALHSESVGKIYVDQGAEEAILYHGGSLFPAGVQEVQGTFLKGDVVRVFGKNGLLGKGEVSCSSAEVMKAIEKRHEEKVILSSVEVIHRNRWGQV